MEEGHSGGANKFRGLYKTTNISGPVQNRINLPVNDLEVLVELISDGYMDSVRKLVWACAETFNYEDVLDMLCRQGTPLPYSIL